MTCAPLFGGISLDEAKRLHQESATMPWARKNLWHVTVDSPLALGDGRVNLFNLFCLSADFSPVTLTGERRKVGAAFYDSLNAAEPIELRLTTLDDTVGRLQSWFSSLAALAAPSDGTINAPSVYATRITIRQAFVDGNQGLMNPCLYRPGSMEISLSRSESALQEVSLSFVQIDTFTPHYLAGE